MNLYPHQKEAVKAMILALTEGGSKDLVVLPTGAGKSVILADFISETSRANNRILVLTHSTEVLEQDARALYEHSGIVAKIYSAGVGCRQIGRVTIATINSIYRCDYTEWEVIVIDEAHRINPSQGMYYDYLSKCPDAKIFGLTATPYRTKSGLLEDNYFDKTIHESAIKDLIAAGFLCAPRYVYTSQVDAHDFDYIKSSSDYSPEELSRYYEQKNEGLLEHLLEHRRGKTIIFCVSVSHVQLVSDILAGKGLKSSSVSSEHGREIDTDIIINCDMLTTGYDARDIETVCVMRATQSMSLWVQMIGRGLRTHHKKPECIVLDYGANIVRHGRVEDITSELVKKIKARKEIGRKTKFEYHICKGCSTYYAEDRDTCPNCGGKSSKAKKYEVLQRTIPLNTTGDLVVQIQNLHFSAYISQKGTKCLKLSLKYPGGTATNYYALESENTWAKGKSKKDLEKLLGRKFTSDKIEDYLYELATVDLDRLDYAKLIKDNGYLKIDSFVRRG